MKASLAFNNANLAQSPALLWTPEHHGEFAQNAGFDAYEWHPLNHYLITPDKVARAARFGSLLLTSYHQSFLEHGASAGTNNTPATTLSKFVFPVLMPEMIDSVHYLGKIDRQNDFAERSVIVTYPNSNTLIDAEVNNVSDWEVAHQVTNNTFASIGASNLVDYLEKIKERKSKIVIDTFHIRRTYGRKNTGPINDWSKSIPALNEEVIAAHISAGRTDIPGEDHIPTDEELKNLVNGTVNGEFAELIAAFKDAPNLKQVTLEVTSSSIKRITGVKRLSDIQKVYAQIASNITSLFE